MKLFARPCTAFYLGLLLSMTATAGCSTSEQRLFPQEDSSSQATGMPPPGGCQLPFKTIAEAIDQGRHSYAYGIIRQVEPITDAFSAGSAHTPPYTDQCRGDIEPGLRLTIELENAGWDGFDQEPLTVSVFANEFVFMSAQPSIDAKTHELRWSDGHRYFPVGQRIGMLGTFLQDGTYNVMASNFFEVDAHSVIQQAREPDACLPDALSGKNIDALIAQELQVRGGEKLWMQPPYEAPLHSVCNE